MKPTSHKLFLGLAFFVLMLCSRSVAWAQDANPLILDDHHTSYPLGLHLEYLEDPGGNLTIEDVTGPEFAARFTPSQEAVPNFGVTRSAYWIRIHLRNETSQEKDWLLAFSDARLGMIDFYYQQEGETGWTHQQAGRWLPATTREYIHPHFVFPLVLSPSSEGTIYLRLEASLALRVSASIWSRDVFEETNHFFFMALGMFYGIMLVMVVYNLMIFLFLRKLSYLYYSLFVTFVTISLGSIDGVVYVYLLPNWTHRYTHLVSTTLLSILAILFIRDFLELKQRSPWLNRILFYIGVICGLLLPIYFLPDPFVNNLAVTAILDLQSLIIILAIVGALMLLRNGLRTARYFLLGWLVLLSNGLILNISAVGLIPSSPIYDWTYYLAIVLMVTLLSLALADQINVLRTEAIQAEQEIRKSEERFRATFEQAAVGIANVALDGRFLRVNQKFCDIVGYSQSELQNLTFQTITHPDDLGADLQQVEQLLTGKITTYSIEKRYDRKDGQIVWVRLTRSMLRKMTGEPDYFIAVIEDITDRKRVELALYESEIKYRTLVEQANAGIIVVQEGKIIFANAFAEELSGYSVGELLNTPFISHIVEGEQSRVFDLYQRRMAGENIAELYETVIKRKDGSRLEVEVNAGLTLYNGKPGDMVIVRDITERKWMEAQRESVLKALDESERKYRTLVQHANDGVAVIQNEKIVFANLRLAKILGCTSESLIDTPFMEYLPAEEHSFISDVYQRREEKNTPSIYESAVQRQDGTRVTVEFSTSLTTYAGELAVLVFVRDITERKNYEAELRRYNEHLEELVAERTRELERSREQLNILNRSSQVVNAAGLDVEQAYVAIRAASSWLMPAEVFGLFRVDQAAGLWEDVFLADGDRRITGGSHPLDQSFIEGMLGDEVSLKVDDFQTSPHKGGQSDWFGGYNGVRSGIAVLLHGKKEVLGALSVQSYQPNAYQDTDLSILESFATHVAITLENMQLYQQAEKSAVLEERQRLARELHDSVTQTLYSMALMSGGWATRARQGQSPDPTERYGQMEELSLQALKEMRLLIHQLTPSILGEVGLLQTLQNRLDAVERRVNLDAQLRIEGSIPAISPSVEEEIYFIIQEALNNSLRHAYATSLLVTIRADEKQLHITVEDNGRGYDPTQPSSGMGTTTMRFRAKAIGAVIQVESKPGLGTKVLLTVNLGPAERRKPHE